MKKLLTGALVALCVGLGLFAAAPAQASPSGSTTECVATAADQRFVGMLNDKGFNVDPCGAVTLGHAIARYIGSHPNDAGVTYVMQQGFKAGIDPYEVGYTIGAAIGIYRPDLTYVLEHYLQSQRQGGVGGSTISHVGPDGIVHLIFV